MKYVSSLCVVCNPCYSKWCYGQNLAIIPQTTVNVWERIGDIYLASLYISRGRGRVNPIFSTIIAKDAS